MPTYLIIELISYLYGVIALYHAWSNGAKYIKIYFYSIVGGIINDHIFMLLPNSNTFWHSNNLIMLSNRMPLYIVFIYNLIIYPAFVLSSNMHHNKNLSLYYLYTSTIHSLIGSFIYALYDYTGVKFIWWVWHTTDKTIINRWGGVPYSSTCWTLVHILSFSILYYIKPIYTILLTTPLMMLLMTLSMLPFNQIGISDKITLIFILSVYSCIVILYNILNHNTLNHNTSSRKKTKNNNILLLIVLYFIYCLLVINLFFDPSMHKSFGEYQMTGSSKYKELDINGYYRNKYLSYNDSFVSFDIINYSDNISKYTIRGLK